MNDAPELLHLLTSALGSIDIGWPQIILLAAAFAMLVALGGCVSCCRSMVRLEKRLMTSMAGVEQDLRIIGFSLKEAGQRVEHMEGELRTLKSAQQSLESRATGSSNYAQAVSLVRRGWRMEDLMQSCGLTRGEAELVYLLHGPGGAMNGQNQSHKS